jgi:hypothetical protein
VNARETPFAQQPRPISTGALSAASHKVREIQHCFALRKAAIQRREVGVLAGKWDRGTRRTRAATSPGASSRLARASSASAPPARRRCTALARTERAQQSATRWRRLLQFVHCAFDAQLVVAGQGHRVDALVVDPGRVHVEDEVRNDALKPGQSEILCASVRAAATATRLLPIDHFLGSRSWLC